ncbi:MAG: hypothetical protein OWU32_10375 [Firmicutes bacterium]|nr:hypothetical protein [Bacillota bacterium]
MKLTRVAVDMSQVDLQVLINGQLPDGYAVQHVHVTQGGMRLKMETPWLKTDLALSLQDASGSDQLRLRVQANKWLPIPQSLVATLLKNVVAQAPAGLTADGDVLQLDLARLLSPWLQAERYHVTMTDGLLAVAATAVNVSVFDAAQPDEPAAMQVTGDAEGVHGCNTPQVSR